MYYWSRADQYCSGGNFTLLSIETREEDLLIHNHIAAGEFHLSIFNLT